MKAKYLFFLIQFMVILIHAPPTSPQQQKKTVTPQHGCPLYHSGSWCMAMSLSVNFSCCVWGSFVHLLNILWMSLERWRLKYTLRSLIHLPV